LSNRDPSPVEGYWTDLADVEDGEAAFDTFQAHRYNPETSVQETETSVQEK
jgi:hypothetical protein